MQKLPKTATVPCDWPRGCFWDSLEVTRESKTLQQLAPGGGQLLLLTDEPRAVCGAVALTSDQGFLAAGGAVALTEWDSVPRASQIDPPPSCCAVGGGAHLQFYHPVLWRVRGNGLSLESGEAAPPACVQRSCFTTRGFSKLRGKKIKSEVCSVNSNRDGNNSISQRPTQV